MGNFAEHANWTHAGIKNKNKKMNKNTIEFHTNIHKLIKNIVYQLSSWVVVGGQRSGVNSGYKNTPPTRDN